MIQNEVADSPLPPAPVVACPPPRAERTLLETLRGSRIYREFRLAFESTTGLSLALQPADVADPSAAALPGKNHFCALLAAHGRSAAACRDCQRRARLRAGEHAVTVTCHAGLVESCVPVRTGDALLAHLQVGQVLLHAPRPEDYLRLSRRLERWGAIPDPAPARSAYFRTRQIDPHRYAGMIELLEIFARHLALLSNALMITPHSVNRPTIQRAQDFILDHLQEELTLEKVAREAHMSSCYFCKVFRRATGLNFIEYVGRARVERVKKLLLNRQIRISEGAYAAGFTSLSQFNRTFKRFVGEEPRAWRQKRG